MTILPVEMDEEEQRRNIELSKKLIQRPGTSRRIGLLRLDYTFSVIVPCLIALYFNNYKIATHMDIIIGFIFYAITGNTLNDMLDAKDPDDEETRIRIQGFHWKEIAVVAMMGFLFGSMFFIRSIVENWINGLILAIIVALVVIYCFKKDIPIINQVLLGISHVFLPYLMIKIDAGADPLINGTEWYMMINFFFYAFSGQIVHEIIDGDAITKFSFRTQQLTVIISSSLTIVFGVIAIIVVQDIYLLPFAFIPLGAIYTFRKPTKSTKGVKDVGIILGNIIMFYMLFLILQNNLQAL